MKLTQQKVFPGIFSNLSPTQSPGNSRTLLECDQWFNQGWRFPSFMQIPNLRCGELQKYDEWMNLQRNGQRKRWTGKANLISPSNFGVGGKVSLFNTLEWCPLCRDPLKYTKYLNDIHTKYSAEISFNAVTSDPLWRHYLSAEHFVRNVR